MDKFKVGDTVKIIKNLSDSYEKSEYNFMIGETGTIIKDHNWGYRYVVKFDDKKIEDKNKLIGTRCWREDELELLSNEENKPNTYKLGQKVRVVKGRFEGIKGELIGIDDEIFSSNEQSIQYILIRVDQENTIKVKFEEIKPVKEKPKMNFKKHKFILSEEFKVYYSNEKVFVILQDGTKGIATVHPEDEFDLDKGINIAYYRAKIQQMQKELDELCK